MNEPPTHHTDLAIIGSGYAGSILAMVARRLGLSVLLLERGQHPRVVIGESSTPLSNLLLEELATRYNLPNLLPLTKYGPWQRTHPELACGLKRGFNFFAHNLAHNPDPGPTPNSNPPPNPVILSEAQRSRRTCVSSPPRPQDRLLVAASPHNEIADTHWYRAHTDHFLVQQAQALGVEYLDHAHLETATETPDGMRLQGHRNGEPLHIHASLVLDATGPRGFLHRALSLPEATLPNYPETEALYNHFSGVGQLSQTFAPPVQDTANGTPYPIDDAAVHHVFEGGWIWILQFNNGITSAGVAATAARAKALRLSEGEPAWQRLLASIPALAEQFAVRHPHPALHLRPASALPQRTIAGNHWALLPSAAGFVDPLFSTGFPLNLLGITRLARILEQGAGIRAERPTTPRQGATIPGQASESQRSWNPPENLPAQLAAYAHETEADLLATARLVAALYRTMGDFPSFRDLSLLYFAAASYSETVRRLGKPHLAPGFLLHNHPTFGPEARALLDPIGQGSPQPEASTLLAEVHRIITPIDVAGLTRTPANSFYPADADDLFAAAPRLGATREEISSLLERAGFFDRATLSLPSL